MPVESGWDLTLDDWAGSTSGRDLSGPSVDTSTWLSASVPGTVLTTLVGQGRLPDPVQGLGNLQVPEALSRHSWWYRRSFERPAGFAVPAWPQRAATDSAVLQLIIDGYNPPQLTLAIG